jgi:YggT family protein
MLFEIFSLLVQVITALIAGTCLLRMYIQLCGIHLSLRSGIPIAPFVFALTNWIVLPLRRVVPSVGRLDTASLIAAYGVLLLKYVLYWSIADNAWDPVHLPIQAAIELISTCISGLFWIVVIYAVASWVPSASPMVYLVQLMVEPLLRPIRQAMPRIGGLDLSAVALIVILQILEIVLHYVSRAVLM